MKIIFSPDGKTGISDTPFRQLLEPKSWFSLYLDYLDEHDLNPTAIEFIMPDRQVASVIETEDGGYEWEIGKESPHD